MKGFSLASLIVSIAIIGILFTVSIPVFNSFYKKSDLREGTEMVIGAVKLALTRTLASQGESQWGVYFTNLSEPDSFILFKGPDYSTRETSEDRVYYVPEETEFTDMDVNGTTTEVVFERVTGTTNNFGSIALALISDNTSSSTVFIDSSGQVGVKPYPPTSDADRVKDARHVHVVYTDTISTTTDSLEATLDDSVLETAVIADNLLSGQLYWHSEVDVGGETQVFTVKTLRINDPDTLFCISRDTRYNTKSFDLDIDSDGAGTPNLLHINADGATSTQGNSIFVEEPESQ